MPAERRIIPETVEYPHGLLVGGATVGYNNPNQDAVVADMNSYGAFGAAIDGVSGSYRAELAARIARDMVIQTLAFAIPYKENLVEALVKTNRAITTHPEVVQQEKSSHAMITLAGIHQDADGFVGDILQLGDTTSHLLRNVGREWKLLPITSDFSNPPRLGTQEPTALHTQVILEPGDQLLLMTGGAYRQLLPYNESSQGSTTRVLYTMLANPPEIAARLLAKRAQNEARDLAEIKGVPEDDITVSILKVPGEPSKFASMLTKEYLDTQTRKVKLNR